MDNKKPAMPKIGDIVWVRGEVVDTFPACHEAFVRSATGDKYYIGVREITHIGEHPPTPPAERKPWQVLREAAELMKNGRGWRAAAVDICDYADELERAANPPDPVTVLREVKASVFMPGLPPQLRERISAAIEAHDAKPKEAKPTGDEESEYPSILRTAADIMLEVPGFAMETKAKDGNAVIRDILMNSAKQIERRRDGKGA